MKKKKRPAFNLNTIYHKDCSPKEIAGFIGKLLDKKLRFIIIPTSKKKCDILITNVPKKLKRQKKNKK